MENHLNLVVVERAPTTALADRLISLLNAEGIHAFAEAFSPDEAVAGELYSDFTGVDVKVPAADELRAREILGGAHQAGAILKDLYDRKDARENRGGADQSGGNRAGGAANAT